MVSRVQAIRNRFNRSAAGAYDTHAQVQRHMADWLADSMSSSGFLSGAEGLDVLEIGCGTGILTELLLERWPFLRIKAIDLSPAMLEAAERRLRLRAATEQANATVIHFLLADVEAWAASAPSASYDLIVSSACFQWLSYPQETLRQLCRILRPGGRLLFSTFGPDTFRELHESFDKAYYANGMKPQRHGLSFPAAIDWQAWLSEAGFSNVQGERKLQHHTYPSVRAFLHSIKAVGASTSEAAVDHGLGARHLFTAMFEQYERMFRVPEGGVQATYELFLLQGTL
ncbi:malonyl-ACP O-methyltransferase BioC [Paenibacillus filicis]|uniref:Malonyl-[acyl-carrier protein] O-methyltransferase n=1 Tax=Paenibacillus gyeongsangnamensis TaxID=3388067 RepID=A0ABT4Q8D2_9BACL|nr:malonyl-ACP O-methyltransferase BioC [Paenibacillus filicis]MCZ8513132.1 malonyl-ACP O-methyltransferase BioC [Paenibacillus filicis]